MVSAREASYAIFGAYRLARFDPGGVQYFDNTPEAFWNSFWVAVLVLPGHALLMMLRLSDISLGAGTGLVLLVEGIAYVASWFAYPLAIFYVAQGFKRSHVYCRYIAAYNWASVLELGLLLGVSAVVASGLLPGRLGALLSLAGTIAILTYQWFIARAAFEATVGGALALVALDLSLSVVINGWADHILIASAVQSG
jgi:hypothetical protein